MTTVLFDSLCRSVSDCLRQCVLKSQLVSLASHQRNLVEILQEQMHLVEVYVTMKAKLSTQPTDHQGRTVVRQHPDHLTTAASTAASSQARAAQSCNQDSERKESYKPVTQADLLRSAPPSNVKGLTVPRPPAPLLTLWKKAPAHTDVLNKKANRCQSSAPQPGNTLQHMNFQMKGKDALIQTRAADNSRHLSKFIQRGVMPCGSALQLLLKVRKSFSHKAYLILVLQLCVFRVVTNTYLQHLLFI